MAGNGVYGRCFGTASSVLSSDATCWLYGVIRDTTGAAGVGLYIADDYAAGTTPAGISIDIATNKFTLFGLGGEGKTNYCWPKGRLDCFGGALQCEPLEAT